MPAATKPNPEFIGKSCGDWKVIGIEPNGKYRKKYLCQCKCGLEKWFWSLDYISGACKTCRPSNPRKYLLQEGDKYGGWTILSGVLPRGKNQEQRYECQCVCGALAYVRGSHLVRGESTRCKPCGAKGRSKRRVSQTNAYISRGIAKERLKNKGIQ